MAKKPSHTFHGIPVLSAISNILFIVPRSRTLVVSNVSFIFSASAELSRISSPIALVICSFVSRALQDQLPPQGSWVELTPLRILTLPKIPFT